MNLKKVLLASSAGILAVPGANAADLPLKVAPMVVPAASWAGWYVGVNLGVASVDMTRRTDSGLPTDYSSTRSGFIGGGQVGYNWQRGRLVYGFEADISGLSVKKNWGNSPDKNASNNVPWLSTVRGRMGVAIDDVLIYATAGVAIGEVKTSTTLSLNSPSIAYSQSKTQVGWTVGGGVEYMLTRNWTVGLEGLYVDLGKTSGTCTTTGNKCDGRTTDTKMAIGRFKLNYKF